MKYAAETGAAAMTYVPSFMKIRSQEEGHAEQEPTSVQAIGS
jgi:hypothetical protein